MSTTLVVAHAIYSTSTADTASTSAIDTTGAKSLIVHVAALANVSSSGADPIVTITVTDSKSNVWTPLTAGICLAGGDDCQSQLFYVAGSAVVGAGHSFTATGIGIHPQISVVAFSDAITLDSQGVAPQIAVDGFGFGSAGMRVPYTLSFSALLGELVITGANIPMSVSPVVVDSGFILTDQLGNNSLAYIIAPGGSLVPKWTWSGFSAYAGSIASFVVTVGTTTPNQPCMFVGM